MNDDIRQLLRAARPSGQDEADPAIMAARQQAEVDPAFLAELAAEHTLDQEIARAYRAVEPPAGLEAAVLAAVRGEKIAPIATTAHPTRPPLISLPETLEKRVLSAVRAEAAPVATAPAMAEIIPMAQAQASRRQWLGWAAALIATGAGSTYWLRQRFTIARLTDRLLDIAHQGVSITLMSMDKNAITAWMTDHKAPKASSLPLALDTLPRKGCHLYDIDGRPVSLECFVLPDMQVLHLFSILSAKLTDAPSALDAPLITQSRDHTIASWRHGSHTMVLLSEKSPEAIQLLLS